MQGWQLKTLGEIAEVQSGGTPLRSHKEYWSGGISWYSSGELNEMFTKESEDLITLKGLEESNAKLFPKGSLLIGMYDTAALKMSILDRDAAFNQAIAGVKPNENIDLRFVLYAINSRKIEILDQRRGVRQKNLSLSKIKNIKLPIPSLSEQKRIVAIVDNAFEGIDRAIANTKKNLTNARELFESYLNSIFTQKGNGWVERQLKDVCFQITDGKHGDCGNEADSGYFFLSAKDVKQDRLNYKGARQITKKDFEETHRRTRLEPGDVLITNSGTIGRTAIAPEDERTYKTTFQKSVAILKPNKELINSEFCRYSLMAHLSEMVAISAGTAQKNLLLRDIRVHRFYLPETVYEQKRIAAKLDEFCQEIQRLEAIYKQKLAALNELKQSILQKAFTGELTADTANQVAKKAEETIAA
ncbi:MAG: restriction endonuclease subunit S [Leptolyngbyaceae cyanobacterium SM1_3_5]|nr:restriction endonuclease subunit S [Leptolyngbyaceae cyanobacterium SM1_3_5]